MTARKRRAAPYKGDLAKPLPPIPYGLYLGAALQGEVEPEAAAAQRQEFVRRFWLLFEHYGIANRSNVAEQMTELAMRLAIDHVPGLRTMKARPGRKTKWTEAHRVKLLMAVGAVMPPAKDKMHAARILITREPWSEMHITAAALRRLMDPATRTVDVQPAPASGALTLRELLKYVARSKSAVED